jgi:glycosyltransferase involved in cell wall biosynthesis
VKVLLVAPYPFGEGGAGIARSRIMAKGLALLGHEAALASFPPSAGECEWVAGRSQFTWEGVPVTTAGEKPTRARKDRGGLRRLLAGALNDRRQRRRIRDLAAAAGRLLATGKTEVAVQQGQDFQLSWRVLGAARRQGAAFVQQYLESFVAQDAPLGFLTPIYLRQRLHFATIPSRADGNIGISRFLADDLARRSGRPALLLPNPIDADFTARVQPSDRPPAEPYRFNYLGLGNRREQVSLMLQAAARLKAEGLGFRFTLAGLAGTALREYREEAAALGLGPETELLGWQDEAGLQRLLESADAYLLLRGVDRSSIACFPGRLRELPLFGKPILFTEVGDFPLYFRDGESALLVPPDDAAALAEKMRWLVQNPWSGVRIGRGGRAAVEREFDNRLLAARCAGYLEECLRRPRVRGAVASAEPAPRSQTLPR